MDDNDIMTFGAHKGKKLANVPAQYLLWLNMQDWFKNDARNINLRNYILDNKKVLETEVMREKR
jgi:Putative quorum-sensing-regulated virulence factor